MQRLNISGCCYLIGTYMLYLLNLYVFQCEMAAITENNQWDHLDPQGNQE